MSNPKTEPTLQQQMAELDALLEWFDQPDIDLDEALKRFDDGIKLTEKLKTRLSSLENKINVLKERFDQDSA
jgi:exodeoxyribonuclease VII small subunit